MSTRDLENLYDLQQVYDHEIGPLMDQILAICEREKLPFFSAFAFAKTMGAEGVDVHLNAHLLYFLERPVPVFEAFRREMDLPRPADPRAGSIH